MTFVVSYCKVSENKAKVMATIEKRMTKAGVKYRARVRVEGNLIQTATFSSKTLAREWAAKTETEMRDQKHMPNMNARNHTFSELLALYKRHIEDKGLRSAKNLTTQLDEWDKFIGTTKLYSLTPTVITSALDQIAKIQYGKRPKSPATLNRYLAALSCALAYAVKTQGWLDTNPVTRVEHKRENKGRTRFLSDTERDRLLNAAKESKNKELYTIIVLAISTGARRGEILSLKWANVDLDSGWAVLEHTKNGEMRGLPLWGPALELVRQLYEKRKSDIWLFPNDKNSGPCEIKRSWATVVAKAKLPDFRFHDLRHTCASYLAMNGASPNEIADVLGHKTLSMVKRYAHLSNAHKSSVVASMNAKIFGGAE